MLRKKAFRDIRKNLSSFVTIFIMTFLGVFVFSGIHSYMDGMDESGKEFYETCNLQDIWILGDKMTEEDFQTVQTIEGVEDAERALAVNCALDGYEDVTIETNFIEENDISAMYVVSGEGFDPEKDGFWFDSYLAKHLGIGVGDELTLEYEGYQITAPVLGLVNTPDHVYSIKDSSAIFPTHTDYGFAYVSYNMFPQELLRDEVKKEAAAALNIDSEKIPDFLVDAFMKSAGMDPDQSRYFSNIYVTLEEGADSDAVKALIQAKITSATAVLDRAANTSYAGYQSEVEEGSTYSSVFTLLFLFIAILSVVSTMGRFVKKQRTQIGTLKALGYKRGKITLHYISFGFYISLIASVCGVLAGKFLLGTFFVQMEASYFEVPEMHVVTRPVVYIVALLAVVMITGVTYFSCRKILREPASEALRIKVPGMKAGSGKHSSSFTDRFSVRVRWNLRDIRRNPGRTLTAIAGVVGCTMLVVCALGMKNTMTYFLDWQFDTLYRFENKLELNADVSDEELQTIYDLYGTQTSMTLAVEATDAEGKKSTREVVVTDASDLLKNTDHSGREMSISDDGIYLSEKLLSILGYSIGDTCEWSPYGSDTVYKTVIAGTTRQPQSQCFTMTRSYAESIGLTYTPSEVYTNEELSGTENIAGVTQIQNKSSLKNGMMSMLSMINMVIALLIVVSVILAVVIIYNLGILSFSEKQYQFATMKVLGFRSRQIGKIYIMQNIWICLTAILIGLPMGYLMTKMIFGMALGDSYDMMVHIVPVTYLFSGVGTFAVTYLVNRLLAGKMKKIDMVSSLKANE